MEENKSNLEIRIKYLEHSKELGVEKETIDETWDVYDKIKFAYSLEGDQIEWLIPILYILNHKNKLMTSDFVNEEIKSISLAKLLRLLKLSFRQFLLRIRKLHIIVNYPKEYCEAIDKIERNFNVTSILFSKYKRIYLDLFKNPFINTNEQLTNKKKTRNSKKSLFKSDDLFKFCWLLFIYVKEKFPAINGDLVNSYHLLLCCLNFIYINIIEINRDDLFNHQLDVKKKDLQIFDENFLNENIDKEGDDSDKNIDTNQSINLIIDYLCLNYDGLLIETKTINEHYFKTHIKYLIFKKILTCSSTKFLGLCDQSNFETNSKSLNSNYEEFFMNFGCDRFDDRIFLNCIKDSEYFSYHADACCFIETDSSDNNENADQKQFNKNENKVDFKSSVNFFTILLKNNKCEPSETFVELINSLELNQSQKKLLNSIRDNLNESFKNTYLSSCLKNSTNDEDEGLYSDYYEQASILYYKIIEVILTNEKKRLNDTNYQTTLNKILQDELFHKLLISISIELVHFSYNIESLLFPWILEAFNIEAYHLIKIIEIFIKSEENFSREQIRHLNSIETRVFEVLVWKNESIVWSIFKEEKIPAYDDVCLLTSSIQPTTVSNDLIINLTPNTATSHASTSSVQSSPFKHPAITRVVCSNTNNNTTSTTSSDMRITSSQFKKSDTIITTTTTTTATNSQNKFPQNDRFLISPVTTKRTTVICAHSQSQFSKLKKRNNSVGIFFRKFYHLATIRLNSLIESLEISELVGKKIWNILEYSIKKNFDLLKDRHIDQLIMCAIHITCRVCNVNRQFSDIIRAYRLKSNYSSNSHVYRNVFIKYNDSNEEVRGDLIQFYNQIYIEAIKTYALKLATYDTRIANNIQLSPVPKINIQAFSPRKIIDQQSVFVSPVKIFQSQAQRPKLAYSFYSGTIKDLEDINDMIKRNDIRVRTNKRKLLNEQEVDDESDSQNKIIINSNNLIHLNKKLQNA